MQSNNAWWIENIGLKVNVSFFIPLKLSHTNEHDRRFNKDKWLYSIGFKIMTQTMNYKNYQSNETKAIDYLEYELVITRNSTTSCPDNERQSRCVTLSRVHGFTQTWCSACTAHANHLPFFYQHFSHKPSPIALPALSTQTICHCSASTVHTNHLPLLYQHCPHKPSAIALPALSTQTISYCSASTLYINHLPLFCQRCPYTMAT